MEIGNTIPFWPKPPHTLPPTPTDDTTNTTNINTNNNKHSDLDGTT